MRLAIFAGTVGDGTLQGAIQYCRDLEVDRLIVPHDLVPGFRERRYLELEAVNRVKQEIENAGMSFSVMQLRPALAVGAPETEAQFSNLCRTIEVMGEAGVEVLSMFLRLRQPEGPGDEEAGWGLVVDLYGRLMAQAERCGVKVALHMGGRLWSYEGLRRLMDDVPSPCNGVTLCIGNLWSTEGEGTYDAIRHLREKVFFIHLRSVMRVPGETRLAWVWFDGGEPDIRKTVQALRDIGYQGDMMPEHLPDVVGGNREDIQAAWAMGYMKALLQYL